MEPPTEPFADWPIQVKDERCGFYLWYLGDGMFATQQKVETLELLPTQRLTRLIDEARAVEAETLRRLGGMVVFHDYRTVQVFERRARSFQQIAWKKLGAEDVRAAYVALGGNPFIRLVGQTFNLLSSRLTGKQMHILDSLDDPLRSWSVTADLAARRYPVRA